MAKRKKRAPARTRKPRSPARVRKRAKKTRGHHHPELWGLGLVAVGISRTPYRHASTRRKTLNAKRAGESRPLHQIKVG